MEHEAGSRPSLSERTEANAWLRKQRHRRGHQRMRWLPVVATVVRVLGAGAPVEGAHTRRRPELSAAASARCSWCSFLSVASDPAPQADAHTYYRPARRTCAKHLACCAAILSACASCSPRRRARRSDAHGATQRTWNRVRSASSVRRGWVASVQDRLLDQVLLLGSRREASTERTDCREETAVAKRSGELEVDQGHVHRAGVRWRGGSMSGSGRRTPVKSHKCEK
ncbi:hypothetical protein AB1Y20_004315 [Prymnesium parvum]|uniref:Uncharacterized protein n=1 Tax=Prymnesium parvum TaxID=97485 RepID=A0AB34IW71_PRYPA